MLNVVAIMGRLTADPELRHTPNNIPVCSFSIACNRSYVRQGGERETDFINVVAWRGTAEFVNKYFRKGQIIAINGSLQSRKYVDQNGNNRTTFEVVADNVHFCESKSSSSAGSSTFQQMGGRDNNMMSSQSMNFESGNFGDFEELDNDQDLPF